MKDRIILQKIQKYKSRISRLYSIIENLSPGDIEEKDEAYALTQYLTNIHSLLVHVSNEDIQQKLFVLYSNNLIKCRNMASHDYDSLNWHMVKELCRKILSEKIELAIKESLDIAIAEENNSKKYT